MKLFGHTEKLIRRFPAAERYLNDSYYRTVCGAVCSLTFSIFFAFYNGILAILSSSVIFGASAAYYLLLSLMRFSAVVRKRKNECVSVLTIGIMLIILSIIFSVTVFISMKHRTVTSYGTITMITIATYTFTKITVAAVSEIKHRKKSSLLIKAIHSIRYSEIAVSILTMQQSMLVSFGDGYTGSDIILNAFTGAGVSMFILTLGVINLKNVRKENANGKIKNR